MPTYGEARLHELVKRLLFAMELKNSDIEWHESDRASAFHTSVGSATVVIVPVDEDGREPYALEILDSEGALIDALRSGTYEDDNGEWAEPWNEDLAALYDRARRNVKNIDEVLDNIMQHLPQLPNRAGGFSDEPPF